MDTENSQRPDGSLRRMVLAIRRLVWLAGALPVLLVAFVIGFTGACLAMLWMGLMWLSGSRERNDEPMMWAMDTSEWLWRSWNRLIGQNVKDQATAE